MDRVSFIKQEKIVAICRRVAVNRTQQTAQALFDGGIRLLEITFDQSSETCISDTAKSIEMVKNLFGDRMLVGAGTVLSTEQAKAAKYAGADFTLSPHTNIALIREIKKLGMTCIPGALTPSEIMAAWDAGADIVKLFPAGNFGIGYVKAILGPISHVPLMAVGGVNKDNVKDFLDNGFCSCGIGTNIVRNDVIDAGKYAEIEQIARAYVSEIGRGL